MPTLKWFFDFHTHGAVEVGARVEADDVARTLQDAGIDEVTFHAKCHFGYAYYPTKVGTPHPKLRSDVFGRLAQACHRQGLRVVAYLSFGIDGAAAQQRPEWQKHFADGPFVKPDWFGYVCPYTGYTDALMLPQIEEVAAHYPVDGFWFDTMSAIDACYCGVCQRTYKDQTGCDLPRSADDPTWDTYGRYRHDRGLEVLEQVARKVHQCNPQASVAFNQIGSIAFPGKPVRDITRISLDFPTRGRQSRKSSLCAAFASTRPYEADVIPTIFTGGWGDWSPAPAQRHEQIATAAWARRCGVNMGDRLHPDGRLTPITRRALRDLAAVRATLTGHLPDPAIPPRADVVVLHSVAHQYGPDLSRFAQDKHGALAPLHGMCNLLIDAGANFNVCTDDNLADVLMNVSVSVVAEQEAISAVAEDALRRYVDGGGQLLVIGDQPPLDWLGTQSEAQPWLDHVYASIEDDEDQVLIRGPHHRRTLHGATSVLAVIPPVDVRYGERFGWGIGPASQQPSDAPLLTRHQVGRGSAWHLAANLASDYHNFNDWRQTQLMRQVMRRICPQPAFSLDAPNGQVEIVGYASDHAMVAVLVNHSGEQIADGDGWARSWGGVVPLDVTLRLRPPLSMRLAAVDRDGVPTSEYREVDGEIMVPFRLDRVCTVVRVELALLPNAAGRAGLTTTANG